MALGANTMLNNPSQISVPAAWAHNTTLSSVARVAILMARDPSLSVNDLMALTGEQQRTVVRARQKLVAGGLITRVREDRDDKLLRYVYATA